MTPPPTEFEPVAPKRAGFIGGGAHSARALGVALLQVVAAGQPGVPRGHVRESSRAIRAALVRLGAK